MHHDDWEKKTSRERKEQHQRALQGAVFVGVIEEFGMLAVML